MLKNSKKGLTKRRVYAIIELHSSLMIDVTLFEAPETPSKASRYKADCPYVLLVLLLLRC